MIKRLRYINKIKNNRKWFKLLQNQTESHYEKLH